MKVLSECCKKWEINFINNHIETHSSYIYDVVRNNNSSAILKIFKPDSDEAQSTTILNIYNGYGSVKIIDSSDEAILIEKITFI